MSGNKSHQPSPSFPPKPKLTGTFSGIRSPSGTMSDVTATGSFEEASENDEELRMAMAMALAVENNPNLTTSEVQELVGSSTNEQQKLVKQQAAKQQQQQPALAAVPKQLAGMFDHSNNKRLKELAKTAQSKISEMMGEENSEHTEWLEELTQKPADLSVLAWKRRGGMGKYSASNWERRNISLSNTILYYTKPEDATVRGHLDIVAEQASINVSLGHSGAPTPYCISIKIKMETRWKIAFDDQETLYTWLNDLSSIVVKNSVETLNKDVAIDASERQTWSVAPYSVSSRDFPDWPPTEDDHELERARALKEATMVLGLPKEHLSHLFVFVNILLFLARGVDTSFWYILVFANFGLYQLLRPVPGNLLDFVKAKYGRPPEKTVPTELPVAGTTAIKLKESDDEPTNAKGEFFGGWRSVPGELLQVRSHGYSTHKEKTPSPGSLYECVAVDIFESPHRYPDMGGRVKLPAGWDDGATKTWRSPDIFIVSIALPTDPPTMGKSSSDGGGYTVTMYYRMTERTREILKTITADGYVHVDPADNKSSVNAVRLFEEWVRRAPTDPKFQSRFKVVPLGHNLKEIGLPTWIAKYNGKPFLIKRPGVTGFLYSHPNCMEFDISLHPFPYIAKKAICFMKESYFSKVLVTFGFVIEGQADDELPECLIGCMQLCYPNPIHAIQAKDFWAGTAPKSTD